MSSMNPDRYAAIRELFLEARSMAREERAAFIDRRCGNDPRMRREIDQLLADSSVNDGFLEEPAVAPRRTSASTDDRDDTESEFPERIGRFRVLEFIDRGGMGSVYRVRDDELKRDLALKRLDVHPLRSRHDASDSRASRFLEEAQIAGQLDHPGIVAVHEVGQDERGRPYFTMKLVRGTTLAKALEDHRLAGGSPATQARLLGVLLQVCDAVAFAHARGVLHRDLKPQNIMLGPFGEVFVMDWGLARVGNPGDGDTGSNPVESERAEIRSRDGTSPVLTGDGDRMGTPAYMAPEQAAGRTNEIGPHSDQYSIGAILYELLAGRRPYEDVASSSLHDVLSHAAEARPTPIERWARSAPPELVAICQRAMQRDAASRYADVHSLAGDLRAYLENRVVSAHRTGPWIEIRKWIARNRSVAALALAVLVTAFGGLAAFGLSQDQKRRAEAAARADLEFEQGKTRAERDRAQQAKERAEAATQRAQDERAKAIQAREEADSEREKEVQTRRIFSDVMALANPEVARGNHLTLREAVRRAVDFIPETDDLLIRASLEMTVAEVLTAAGLWRDAAPVAREAFAIRERELGWESHETALAASLYSELLFKTEAVIEAPEVFEKVHEYTLGRYEPGEPNRTSAAVNLATLRLQQRRAETALELLDEALKEHETRFGDARNFDTIRLRLVLAQAELPTKPIDVAIGHMQDAMEISRAHFGLDHPMTFEVAADLAGILYIARRYAESEAVCEEYLPRMTRVLSDDHPDTCLMRIHHAQAIIPQGRAEQALEVIGSLDLIERNLGNQHVYYMRALNTLAFATAREGKYEEAEGLLRRAREAFRTTFGPDHANTVTVERTLARVLTLLGRYDEALPLAEHMIANTPQTHTQYSARKAEVDELRKRMSSPETPNDEMKTTDPDEMDE